MNIDPADMPDDIKKIAADVVASMPNDGNNVQHVALAMWAVQMTEREFCAQVAEAEAGWIRLGGPHAWHGASKIAEAIRNRDLSPR